jgi:hypothetical protein
MKSNAFVIAMTILCGVIQFPGYAWAEEVNNPNRDAVGDLNAPSVKAGDFPGAIQLPGDDGISLAIGGFVKTAAIVDSDAEKMGADFLPATLGPSDNNGAFSLDSTLTRVNLDARTPVPDGQVRGYIEYDLNASNSGSLGIKMRHAYGTWNNHAGMLTVGHTWSTMMDLLILPEGLTEPTVSGVIFQRQPVISWSQSLSDVFTYYAAVEDPSNNDVFSNGQPALGTTSIPDVVLGIKYARGDLWHLRLNGIMRRIELTENNQDYTETGYGFALTGHVNISDKDRLVFNGVNGRGLGRYLLGIESLSAGAINPADNSSELRDNSGLMLGYKHQWSPSMRSTAMAGYASAKPFSWQAGNTFDNSSYASVNLMWQVQKFLTMGFEYAYGTRENKDGSELDNHRIAFGIQVF